MTDRWCDRRGVGEPYPRAVEIDPGEVRWHNGYTPLPAIGPCPHSVCEHLAHTSVAMGPSAERYELVDCGPTGACWGRCRAWTGADGYVTTPWLQVREDPDVPAQPHDAQAIESLEGDWVVLCATCPAGVVSGLTPEQAYDELAKHAPDPEAWITPSGKPGYRTRRGAGPLGVDGRSRS